MWRVALKRGRRRNGSKSEGVLRYDTLNGIHDCRANSELDFFVVVLRCVLVSVYVSLPVLSHTSPSVPSFCAPSFLKASAPSHDVPRSYCCCCCFCFFFFLCVCYGVGSLKGNFCNLWWRVATTSTLCERDRSCKAKREKSPKTRVISLYFPFLWFFFLLRLSTNIIYLYINIRILEMPDIPVVVLGGGGVGKSCLTIQYMQGHFVDKYDATIEDVYRKPVDVDNQPAVLVIIDTAGQDAFGAMRDQYLKKGQGFVLVYSITDPESFRQIKRIYAQLLRVKGDQVVPCVVVGNKIDQASYRAVSTEDGSLFAGQVSCPFLEVTAKNRRMAEDVFETLVRTIRNDGKSSADQMQVHVANTVTPSVPMAHVEAEQSNCAVGSSLSSSSPSKQQQDRATAPPTAPEKRSKKKKSRCALL